MNNDWSPETVIEELHKRGTSLRKLSIEHGYKTASALSAALRKPYPKSEKVIADAIGLSPNDIWPERYQKRRARFEAVYGSQVEIA